MWDENGQWIETEVEPARGLRRILCRPMKHLWLESPEARARQGQVREGFQGSTVFLRG